jgi:hypothetical protein
MAWFTVVLLVPGSGIAAWFIVIAAWRLILVALEIPQFMGRVLGATMQTHAFRAQIAIALATEDAGE